MIRSWAARITPSSSGATSLDADAAVDGVDTPLARPDRARATMISATDGSAPTCVKTSIDTVNIVVPATTDHRSPTLTAA